jgi:transposase
VREIARVGGKPKVISQIYLGSPERVRDLARGEPQAERTLQVQEFGALWLAQQMDQDVGLAGIINAVIKRGARETGPTVGEYFLYAVLNRMVEPRSKRALPDWYRCTAIQQIRPVDVDALTSERYWEKWERVSEAKLEKIARKFFEKIWELESPQADCMLFDTSNYYTFMASDTESDLAQRGKNKAGRHHLRQIGLALLVDRGSRLPLYYQAYPGNRHDSREFATLMDEMFGIVCGLNQTKERLTVVIDKGMNAEGNFSWIDEHSRIHFVTSYSTYFAEDLVATPLERFELVDTEKNKRLAEQGHADDRLRAFRTQGVYWGKERSVVVTYYPPTARKQGYTFDSKLTQLREELLEMRAKVRAQSKHWRDPNAIRERYLRSCERFHISSACYELSFAHEDDRLTMSFRKNIYHIEQKRQLFGKSIIITDNIDWSTTEIVEAHLGRWEVEDRFRQSKDPALVGVMPLRHWTDSKIRCHLFTCVVALTYLRRLERRLHAHGIPRTAKDVMDDMDHLHSVLTLEKGARKPRRRLETPTKTQTEVLSALDYRIDARGVLQPLTA